MKSVRRPTGLLVLLLASCSLERDFSEAFLWPSSVEVAVPTDFGLEYEDVTLETGSETTLNGWFIPSSEAEGRTVVFSHGNGINITSCHPYYTFLHEAGFNVFLYDYRGFRRSLGGVSMDAMLSDPVEIMDYLRSRPDVDADKIALYGVSVGTLPALRGASRFAGIAGVVVEDVVSPEEYESQREGGGGIGSFFSSYVAIPWALDPENSAADINVPMLYMTGSRKVDLDLQFRVYNKAKGAKSLWIIPDAGNAPTALLVQDREYQWSVSRFLEQCFAGQRLERVAVDYRARQQGQQWMVQATLRRQGTDTSPGEPWPVEITFLHQGQISFHRVWLEDLQQTFDLNLPARPMRSTAWRYGYAVGSPGSGNWVPDRTVLSASYQVYQGLIDYVETMRSESSVDNALAAIDAIQSAERQQEFAPVLEAELAELYWFVGRELINSDDPAEKEQGRVWLERCVAGVPDDPAMHYWPDSEELFGFSHIAPVAQASLVLAEYYREEDRNGDAVRVLEAAARVAPEDPAVRQKLAEIRQGRG